MDLSDIQNMKRRVKKILRYIGFILMIPITYLLVSLILTYIPVDRDNDIAEKKHSVYLSSNGIHLEIIIPKENLDPSILNGLTFEDNEDFFSFGWGDRTFYIKTSTWSDFTILNKCRAAFFKTPALLHVTRYTNTRSDWVEIKMTPTQFMKLNTYINNAFRLNERNEKVILPGLGYYKNDNFYEAIGNYSCFNTCNTWVNTALKQSGIKACLWTPYDFRLLDIHQ